MPYSELFNDGEVMGSVVIIIHAKFHNFLKEAKIVPVLVLEREAVTPFLLTENKQFPLWGRELLDSF